MSELTEYEKEVMDYFYSKAKDYDDVEKQSYWRLSDRLLWSLIQEQLSKLPDDFYFLDAGGGTGRWSKKILENYPRSIGVLVDLSDKMMTEAVKKNVFGERWKVIIENIQNLNFDDNTFDLVINTHNVLGFVEDTKKALGEMSRVLKKNGILISVVPNVYHGAFFNLFQSNINGAKRLITYHKGKFVNNMPELNMFTPLSIKNFYKKAGILNPICFGFPILIYPGYQETQLHGETKEIADFISINFDKLYELELKCIKDEECSARGNNLFIFGLKK